MYTENHLNDIFLTKNWEQYDQLRLDRIKQQRQRMQHMKDVIEQYTKIIRDLQKRNRDLAAENDKIYQYEHLYNELLIENKELSENYQWTKDEMEKQKESRRICEQTIQKLKLEMSQKNYTCVKPDIQIFYEREKYDNILLAYQDIKDQLYFVQRQNFQLKQAIKGQSKMFYESEKFKKLYPSQSKNEKMKTPLKEPGKIKHEYLKEGKENIKNVESFHSTEKKNKTFKEKIPQSVLKEQLKKQSQLIEKYKHTEEQQNELIELLKMKSRCPCHTQGKSKTSLKSKANQFSFKDMPNARTQN